MAALLPTRTNINPSAPIGAEYFEQGQVLYILRDGTKRAVATSFGWLQGWQLGTWHEVRHDQTGHRMGHFEVIGIINTIGAETSEDWQHEGEIPNRRIPHWVFK